MMTIDGSQGEGGGQVLRTALALSVATGKAFRIERIRARRRKPGLMRQHLTCVDAAQAIGKASVEGASLGSSAFSFTPRGLVPGRHEFRVGTAGSVCLVLQAALPPLLQASEASEISVEGGTHAAWAPTADFLRDALAPLLCRMGAKVTIDIERHGFYPAGGGRVVARVEPAPGGLRPLQLHEQGGIVSRTATALCSRLPAGVAQRELTAVQRGLSWHDDCLRTTIVKDSPGPGNALILRIETETLTEVFTAIGDARTPSEAVAKEAVSLARRWLAADVPVGVHLADQLMVPLALAGGGSFKTLPPSSHSRTNDEVLRSFVDLPTSWTKNRNGSWTWAIGPDALDAETPRSA